jgi:hypothetical protein
LADLADGGVSYEDIESAYRHLATVPSVPFPRDGSVADQMAAIKEVMNNSTGLNLKLLNRMASGLPTILTANRPNHKGLDKVTPVVKMEPVRPSSPVVVLGDGLTPETVVSCRILQQLMQVESRLCVETCTIGTSLTPNELASIRSAKYVFVLLTNELLSNPAAIALLVLLASYKDPPEFVPCSVDRTFSFPSVSFYADIVNGKALSEDFLASIHSVTSGADPDFSQEASLSLSLIADAYRDLFTKLSLPFSPQGSKEVIDVEVQGLLRRLKFDDNSAKKDHPPDAQRSTAKSTAEQVVPETEDGMEIV